MKTVKIEPLNFSIAVGRAKVSLNYFMALQTLIVEPNHLKPLVLSVDEARKADAQYYSHHLSHSVIYYVVTEKTPPKGDFNYPDFQVEGHDFIMLSQMIKTLIEVQEGNTGIDISMTPPAAPIIGAGRI